MNNQEWRVLDGEGNEQGPYSFEDLQGYYTTGNITHETMIWTEGLEEWVPAGQVEGLLPDVPQVVPLAAAPTVAAAAPTAQPVAAGGINLSPQIPGIAQPAAGQAQAAQPQGSQAPKDGAPTWLSILTIFIGVASLVLYFFPWVSISQDISMNMDKNVTKIMTQSGMESITQDASPTDEFFSGMAKMTGMSVDELRESFEKANEEGKKSTETPAFDKSTLNLIAMIAIGIGLVLALIGLLNRTRIMTMFAQVLFASGAILIGIQMAQQFPMVAKYIEMQELQQKSVDEAIERQEKMAAASEDAIEAVAAGADDETKADIDAKVAKSKAENKETIAKTKAKGTNRFATAFEPSCFITVALLGICILLVVVTMSAGQSSTIIVANPSLQPQPGQAAQPQQPGQAQQPAQPQQPGSGLKFH